MNYRRMMVAGAVAAAALLAGMQLTLQAQQTRPATSAGAPAAQNRDAALSHYAEARKQFDQQNYAEAKNEVDQALALDPGLQDAKLLRMRIESHLTETPGGGGAAKTAKTELLTPEQISRIRVLELGPRETELRGSIPRKALEDFWNDVILHDQTLSESSKTTTAHDRFLSPSNFPLQVEWIRKSNAVKYLEQIKLDSDPEVMKSFKRVVQPYLLQNCGNCHNARSEHKFKLYGTLGNVNDAQTYTNFYILNTYNIKNAFMVDRQSSDSADHSLFIQYAMPREQARFKHPGDVELPRRLTTNSDTYRQLVAWVKSLAFPKPDYGIKWQPEGTTPAPATTATQPK